MLSFFKIDNIVEWGNLGLYVGMYCIVKNLILVEIIVFKMKTNINKIYGNAYVFIFKFYFSTDSYR
jgi:hypothetical protein